MTAEQLLKSIPKPNNEDVIIYNIELKDLIDIDVLNEYKKLLPTYLEKKEKYLIEKKEIEEIENFINNVYLSDHSWGEEDYLLKIKDLKKTYATLYAPIKKSEDKISVYEKKIKSINEKIEIQQNKEKRNIENYKQEVDDKIETNKSKLFQLKSKMSDLSLSLNIINTDIQENQEEFMFLQQMESEIKEGEYQCKYCGSKIKVHSKNSLIYKRLLKNFTENKTELEKLLERKNKIDMEIASTESAINKIKEELSNDIQFKKDNATFYQKKSLEVLKLEALKDELIKYILQEENFLKTNPMSNSDAFKTIKQKISRYETSLDNLKKIRELKIKNSLKLSNFKELKDDLNNIYDIMNKYKEFITIYYKICEQKTNNFLGEDFKIKLFSFDDMTLNLNLDIIYKNTKYEKLSSEDRKTVDKIIAEKISFFD